MTDASKMLHIRLDEHIKEQASSTLATMGLTISEAVRVFLAKVITEKAIPFSIHAPKEPNQESREAILEARELLNNRAKLFDTPEALFNDIEKAVKK